MLITSQFMSSLCPLIKGNYGNYHAKWMYNPMEGASVWNRIPERIKSDCNPKLYILVMALLCALMHAGIRQGVKSQVKRSCSRTSAPFSLLASGPLDNAI